MIPQKSTTDFLNKHSAFAVFTHLNPDGDALGSAFSLVAGLRALNKIADVYLFAPIPYKYNFNVFEGLWKYFDDFKPDKYNAFVSVDCADIKRLGEAENIFNSYSSLNIDHHISNTAYASINYIKQTAATGEIIYEILKSLNCPITIPVQIGVYMAIAADTGNFTFPNTSKSSFEICADIVNLGMPISEISDRIFNSRSLAATLLIAVFIERIRLFYDDKVSISYILLDDLKQTGAKLEDCETLIGFGRAVNTVELAIFIREISENNYKISLRSKKDVDVTKIAALFGGGGHKNAAGCTMKGDFEYVMQSVIDIAGDYIT